MPIELPMRKIRDVRGCQLPLSKRQIERASGSARPLRGVPAPGA